MKLHKSTLLIVLLGLLLTVFAVGFAQSPNQTDQKAAEGASCPMDSCCCKGDSCPMKSEGTKNAHAKDACCCCSGDSCDVKSKENMKNHSEMECCRDMEMKHDQKKAA